MMLMKREKSFYDGPQVRREITTTDPGLRVTRDWRSRSRDLARNLGSLGASGNPTRTGCRLPRVNTPLALGGH
jgi:hypothetical protein